MHPLNLSSEAPPGAHAQFAKAYSILQYYLLPCTVLLISEGAVQPEDGCQNQVFHAGMYCSNRSYIGNIKAGLFQAIF